jgi:hypothetical protein
MPQRGGKAIYLEFNQSEVRFLFPSPTRALIPSKSISPRDFQKI